jgi:hypothetical protein
MARTGILPVNWSIRSSAASRATAPWCAFAAVLAVLACQAATVHFNYGGNWTALFCTGDRRPTPPDLAAGTYQFHNSDGYDGQYYRYIAGDPWMRQGRARYVESAEIRYGRILVPAVAWLLAAGNPARIDAAYILTLLLAVGLGVMWLGRYAELEGRSAAWGLLFLVLPATLISADRMTVDGALGALSVGAVYYARRNAYGRLCVVLAAAVLVRETGLLLVAAACAWTLGRRLWKQAAGCAAAALPALAWHAFLAAHFHSGPSGVSQVRIWFSGYPLAGIVMTLFRPVDYPFAAPMNRLLNGLDTVALCGVLVALGMAAWSLRRRPFGFEQWMALMFLALAALASLPGFWNDVYNYGRPLSPLLLMVALPALRGGGVYLLAPVVLTDLRIAIQLAAQAAGVLRALF